MSEKENTKKESTEEKIELPKGVNQKMYDMAKKIIVSGFKADQTPDAIKSALFSQDIPFSKLNKLYTMITRSEKLVVDPKEVNMEIGKVLGKTKLKYDESYAQLEELAGKVAENIDGATPAKVIAALKVIFKENEKDFPRKPAPTRGRMGVLNKTMIDVFKKNKKATEKELFEALAKVTKTEKNAMDYTKQYHKMLFAVANDLSSLEVLTLDAKAKESK